MSNYTTPASEPSSVGQDQDENPRPSNYGGNGVKTYGHLDYLAVTFPHDFPLQKVLPIEIKPSFEEAGRGRYGYRKAYRHKLGVLVMTDGEERQGTHVVMSGEPLGLLREQGLTDRQLCNHILDECGSVTRLDVAIDIHGGELRPADLEVAYLGGQVKTPAQSGVRVYGVNKEGPSDTFYLGSRTSDRYLRFYAKGGPEVDDPEVYMRLELELKKLRAMGANALIATQEDTRAVINAEIGNYVSWPENNEFTGVLVGGNVALPEVPRKQSDWERWIEAQVVPSMVRQQLEHPDKDILQFVVERYATMLEKQTGRSLYDEE